MEAELRAADVPLYSLETRHALSDFDVIGFSLPYEQLYTNVLNMLDLAGLPLRAADRGADHPLILAGGSGCYNPEPMSAFFDAMVIGEGEEVMFEIVEAYAEWKNELSKTSATLLSPPSPILRTGEPRSTLHHPRTRSLAPPGANSRRLRATPLRRELSPRRHPGSDRANRRRGPADGRQTDLARHAGANHGFHRAVYRHRPQPGGDRNPARAVRAAAASARRE